MSLRILHVGSMEGPKRVGSRVFWMTVRTTAAMTMQLGRLFTIKKEKRMTRATLER